MGTGFYHSSTIDAAITANPRTDALVRLMKLWREDVLVNGAAQATRFGSISTSHPVAMVWDVHLIEPAGGRLATAARQFFDRVDDDRIRDPYVPALLVVADNQARSSAHWISIEDRVVPWGLRRLRLKSRDFVLDQGFLVAGTRSW